MQFGCNDIAKEYVIRNVSLKSTLSEKNLGVTIHKSWKPGVHIGNSVKKAKQMLGIRRSFKYRKKIHY